MIKIKGWHIIVIAIIIVFALFLVKTVGASSCYDNYTLKTPTSLLINDTGVAVGNLSVDVLETCPYGCENGSCNPNKVYQYLIILGVVGVGLFLTLKVIKWL